MKTTMDQHLPMLNFEPPQEPSKDRPPPAYDGPMTNGTSLEKKRSISKDKVQALDVDVRSVNSTTSSIAELSDTLLPNVPFTPGPSFHVAARGIAAVRLPFPSSELEIDILKPDGSVAYTSTRARKSKGDCILASIHHGTLISTNYFWGPSRQPILRYHNHYGHYNSTENGAETFDKPDSIFDIKSKWTSRAITMVHRESGRVFEWSYEKMKTVDKKKANLLVLRQKSGDTATEVNGRDDESDGKGKVLAQLIRSDATRTPGSKSCSAGNGGQLVLDQEAAAALNEPLIVATCLMMLKKEIDRRRAIQMAMMAGIASGGGGG